MVECEVDNRFCLTDITESRILRRGVFQRRQQRVMQFAGLPTGSQLAAEFIDSALKFRVGLASRKVQIANQGNVRHRSRWPRFWRVFRLPLRHILTKRPNANRICARCRRCVNDAGSVSQLLHEPRLISHEPGPHGTGMVRADFDKCQVEQASLTLERRESTPIVFARRTDGAVSIVLWNFRSKARQFPWSNVCEKQRARVSSCANNTKKCGHPTMNDLVYRIV